MVAEQAACFEGIVDPEYSWEHNHDAVLEALQELAQILVDKLRQKRVSVQLCDHVYMYENT